MENASAQTLGGQLFCSECGKAYSTEDLARFGTAAVCGECKPHFVQRMQEGAAGQTAVVYGGFWRRAVALILDAIILMVINFPFQLVLGIFSAPQLRAGNPSVGAGLIAAIYLISLSIQLIYYTYFVSQKGATPGKMVMGLKVVTANGGRVSPARAAGRYFAQILSGMILLIGYIIAAFDSEKRTLHDHICGTRVIRTA